jgi:hypothetical protein
MWREAGRAGGGRLGFLVGKAGLDDVLVKRGDLAKVGIVRCRR